MVGHVVFGGVCVIAPRALLTHRANNKNIPSAPVGFNHNTTLLSRQTLAQTRPLFFPLPPKRFQLAITAAAVTQSLNLLRAVFQVSH